MLRKTLTTLLAVLLVAVTVAASAAASASASKPGQSRKTICHDPPGNTDGARTMDIPESAWKAHRDHGDHEGACTQADRDRSRAPPPADPSIPRTALSLAAHGDGDVDGDAVFKVVVRNDGHDLAKGVSVEGTLTGKGRWTVEGQGDLCSVDAQQRLRCAFGDLPAQSERSFRLRFDGPVSVCGEAKVVLALSAANDGSAGDDRVRESVDVGACAVTDGDRQAVADAPF